MGTEFSLNKTHLKLFMLWIAILMYYNTIECFLVIDRLRHLEIIRYPIMNMRITFILFPIISCFTFFFKKKYSKILYYSLLTVLCLAYSYVIILSNIVHFPIKTWGIIILFVCNMIVDVFLNNVFDNGFFLEKSPFLNRLLAALLSFSVITAIIITVVCHTYIV